MNDPKQNDDATQTGSTDEQPRKLLLGKRVVRHFNVRSSVQTGLMSTGSDSQEELGTYSVVQRCRQY